MAAKATAAKAKAEKSTGILAADNKRKHTEEQRALNDAGTLLKRMATGQVKKSNEEQISCAKAGLDLLKTLGKDEKVAFAKRVEQTKANKNFAWVREFKESLSSKTLSTDGVLENYYTRTVM